MDGLVIGGTASGVGKTVASLAVMRAFDEAGLAIQPAKAGPDFIDPTHHEAVTGRPSRTLDPWLCGEEGMRRNYHRGEGDVCVIEGVMGLYDGEASTALVADRLDLPVVLVVDASAGMESVGATALGFREYADRVGLDTDVAGVIAQRAHGGTHADGIRDSLPDGMAYLGRIGPDEDLSIPERHLGLELGGESPLPEAAMSAATEALDVAGLQSLARPATPPSDDRRDDRDRPDERTSRDGSRATGTRPTVAVASDDAFCFRYPATIERLRELGRVEPFSPVAGDSVPPAADGVYLPGGYPELHAEALAAGPTLGQLADRASDGLPILGECGGMMALAESLETTDGRSHAMAGVLPAHIAMAERFQALDYVRLRARESTLTASRGETLPGHEFHYSSAAPAGDARFAFDVERGRGIDGQHDGLTEYRTLGTYAHVHPESGAFDAFLDRLRAVSGP